MSNSQKNESLNNDEVTAEQQTELNKLPTLRGKEKLWFLAFVGAAQFNATKAARLAGYQAKTENGFACIGYQNYRKLHIFSHIERFLDEYAMEAKECLARLSSIARASLEDLVDDKGNFDYQIAKENNALHLIKKLKRKTTSKQIKRETEEYSSSLNDEAGEETLETSIIYEEVDVELHDVLTALIQIGKHHKLFTENHHVSGELEFVTFEIEKGNADHDPHIEP